MDIAAARETVLRDFNAEEYDHFGKVAFRLKAKKAGGKPGRTFMTLWLDEGYAVLMLDKDRQAAMMDEDPEVFRPHPSKWGEKGSTIMHLEKLSTRAFRTAVTVAVEYASR